VVEEAAAISIEEVAEVATANRPDSKVAREKKIQQRILSINLEKVVTTTRTEEVAIKIEEIEVTMTTENKTIMSLVIITMRTMRNI
jgi:hypothetical protein